MLLEDVDRSLDSTSDEMEEEEDCTDETGSESDGEHADAMYMDKAF